MNAAAIHLIENVVTTIVFAYACGRHDVPAIDNFTFYGSNAKHQSQFHFYNGLLKTCYVICVAAAFFPFWGKSLLLFVIDAAIIWGLFDPVVAIFRTVYTAKKPWYYLSEKSNITDRTLLKLFGPKAGIYKAAGMAIIAAVAIFFYLKIY